MSDLWLLKVASSLLVLAAWLLPRVPWAIRALVSLAALGELALVSGPLQAAMDQLPQFNVLRQLVGFVVGQAPLILLLGAVWLGKRRF
jgi:hypothetical protein